MKIFEYAVIFIPNEDDKKNGLSPTIVVPITQVLAANKDTAALRAARDIPTDFIDKFDRLEVAVRPF